MRPFKLLPSFTGEEVNFTTLNAELAAIAGTSDECRSVGSAGRPLSRHLRHPQYDTQLHTAAMLAQGKALLTRSNRDASMLCRAQPHALHQHHSLGAEPQLADDPSQKGASIIDDSDPVREGPLKVYLDGRKSGLYRPDPRQETTIKLLQNLYEQLKKLHVDHKRPSGLTTTDHIGSDKRPRHSWYFASSQCEPSKPLCTAVLHAPMHASRAQCYWLALTLKHAPLRKHNTELQVFC